MKHKVISTTKADILVVELPEGGHSAEVNPYRNNSIWFLVYDGIINRPYAEEIPPGNWQPLTFDEDIAEEIVERMMYEDGETMMYKRYGHEGEVEETATGSLQSLIKANVQKENPYQSDWDELCKWGHGGFAKDGKTELELYSEPEKSVFRNPYYFYKLK